MKPRRDQRRPATAQATSTSPQRLVEIEKPIYGGAFLARDEGKAVFVPFALPGEQVRVRLVEEKRGYATAELEQLVTAAPQRIAPACPHFGPCGGCHYQHAAYETQLQIKPAILRETLQRGGINQPLAIDILAGSPWAYRNRIRLAFDAHGNPGYRGRRSHAIVPIRACPIAAPLLVRASLATAEIARHFSPALKPAEIALFCNAGETALLLGVFVASPDLIPFDDFALALSERIPELSGAELVVEGRPGQPPRTLARWGETFLAYRALGIDYRVDNGAFFQVNRWVIDQLVDRVISGHAGKLAWDLFAGVGLFARQLTASFERVAAVESSPAATDALSANLSKTTGSAVRASTLDFLRRHQAGKAPDQLVPGQKIPDQKVPDLIVVDPPRTGLGPDITSLLVAIAPPALVYVSCDPATLARDLQALLAAGYAIESITLADLFPQTFHIETVVRLRHP